MDSGLINFHAREMMRETKVNLLENFNLTSDKFYLIMNCFVPSLSFYWIYRYNCWLIYTSMSFGGHFNLSHNLESDFMISCQF